MTTNNEERRPGTGGVPSDPAGSEITPSVPVPSVIFGVDVDGVVLLTVTAIVAVAGRALERGHDPEGALVEVADLARKIEALMLNELFEEAPR